jgi:hypothetical protein
MCNFKCTGQRKTKKFHATFIAPSPTTAQAKIKAADNACMAGGGSLKGFYGMGDEQNLVKISVPRPLTRSIE